MSSLKEVKKYEDLTFGHWKALATKCGGLENVLAILQEEKTMKIEDVLVKLFDKHGRRIPHNLENRAVDANCRFYLNQPKMEVTIDFAHRLVRVEDYFGNTGLRGGDFERKTKDLIEKIEQDRSLANLLQCPHFPVVIPKTKVDDYGKVLEQKFIPAVKKAYQKQFPGREFYNQGDELEGNVSIAEGSRQDILIKEMKKGPVVGIYFANPLQGFSILASREQMKDLPERLLLAGGFDIATAMIMYPDVLAPDGYTPGLDLAALSMQSSGCSLGFSADDGRLNFDGYRAQAYPYSGCSAGLLFIG